MDICLTNNLPICSADCPMLSLDYEDLRADGHMVQRVWMCADQGFCNNVLRHLIGKLRPALERNDINVNELAAVLQNDK